MESVRLVLPLPPRALSPNARQHWSAKARETKKYRAAAWAVARQHGPGRGWERASVEAVFYLATNRRRDGDNLLASMKAAFDGIADAGVVVDDSGLRHLPPRIEIDKERPRVELTLTAITDGQ